MSSKPCITFSGDPYPNQMEAISRQLGEANLEVTWKLERKVFIYTEGFSSVDCRFELAVK